MPTTQADPAAVGPAPRIEVSEPSVGPESGLSAAQAAGRLAEDGPNALPGGQRRSLLAIAVATLREPMFLLLLAAGCASLKSKPQGRKPRPARQRCRQRKRPHLAGL